MAIELQQRTAAQLFKVLGELKGGAMKFGQALSVLEAALPEEVAGPYRAALTKLQEAAPAHARPQRSPGARRASSAPIGAPSSSRSTTSPAAAASIGQVHRAVWHDGREVAVKVQYPGAGPALISDLNQLARAARLFATLSPGMDVKPLLVELKARVVEELDYLLEAGWQRAFAEAYDGDPDIVVPKVIDGSGTGAGDRMARRHSAVDDHRAKAARRNVTGPDCCSCASCTPVRRAPGCCTPTRTPATSGCWPDGRLGVLDFGAVNRLPEGLPEPAGRLARLALEGDAQAVYDGLRTEKFILPTAKLDPQPLLDFLLPLLGPDRGAGVHLHARPGCAARPPGSATRETPRRRSAAS